MDADGVLRSFGPVDSRKRVTGGQDLALSGLGSCRLLGRNHLGIRLYEERGDYSSIRVRSSGGLLYFLAAMDDLVSSTIS